MYYSRTYRMYDATVGAHVRHWDSIQDMIVGHSCLESPKSAPTFADLVRVVCCMRFVDSDVFKWLSLVFRGEPRSHHAELADVICETWSIQKT